MMSFAGIWSRSSDESPTTFAVLTTDSVGEAKKYHHRMPVILRPGKERIWLPTGPGLLIPPQNEEDAIMAQRVSEAVNDVGFNAPEAIKPVADDSLLFIQKLA